MNSDHDTLSKVEVMNHELYDFQFLILIIESQWSSSTIHKARLEVSRIFEVFYSCLFIYMTFLIYIYKNATFYE
jgi:hypothetical protein